MPSLQDYLVYLTIGDHGANWDLCNLREHVVYRVHISLIRNRSLTRNLYVLTMNNVTDFYFTNT